MEKVDYLYEDKINPPKQKWYCVSFFSKNYVKKAIDNNNETAKEIKKDNLVRDEDYTTDDNVLALKIRGGFETYEQACNHASALRNIDQHHHIYIFEAGKWCAFKIKDNDDYIEQTEHANEELNDMMKKYNENQDKAKIYHEFRKNLMVKDGLNENIDSKIVSLDETTKMIESTEDETEKNNLQSKKESLDDQINKLQEKKNEIDRLCKAYEEKLKLGKFK